MSGLRPVVVLGRGMGNLLGMSALAGGCGPEDQKGLLGNESQAREVFQRLGTGCTNKAL
jgi:hypothetical protein